MKTSALVLAGLLGAGTIAGGTMAVRREPAAPPPKPTIAAPSPTAPTVIAAPDIAVPTPNEPTAAAPKPVQTPIAPTPKRTKPPVTVPGKLVRKVTSCKVLMAIVKDANPPLNVRSGPSTTDKIVGTINDGAFVSVKQEQNGWLEIATPAGWIAKSKTASRCGHKVEQVSFGRGNTGAAISDEFLGSGSHKYKMTLGKGQNLTIKGAVGPMPAVVSPEGKYIVGMDQAQGSWSTQLPSSGEYTFELDSNFKGYKYDFVVEVQ
ncbi:SH3 domain-containing protein [filamentous cyanobacterium LEGE 11480]|uniref:SH3 domain-containing protein n=1 Tax=Romeriopsis navalis LEGE 11480 TaxID=2777977 RepID=A0A928VV43_9CYAN|nr:SH3 domain-containing protein [Romeriopsis navalis]MBE9033067.1 SH3 domain-containing protein [Romeriopsis navalis LEGE 11480]